MRHASSLLDLADAAAGYASTAVNGNAEVAKPKLSRRKGKHVRKMQQQQQQQLHVPEGSSMVSASHASPAIGTGIANEALCMASSNHASTAFNKGIAEEAHVMVSSSHASPAHFEQNCEQEESCMASSGHATTALFKGIAEEGLSTLSSGHASPAISSHASPAHLAEISPTLFDCYADQDENASHASPALPEGTEYYTMSDDSSVHTSYGLGHAPPAHFNRIAVPPFVSWHDLVGLQKWQPAFFDGNPEVAQAQSYLQSKSHFDEIAEVAKLRTLVSELKDDGLAEEAQLHLLSSKHHDEVAEVAQLRLHVKTYSEYGKAEEAQLRMQSSQLEEIAEVAKLRLQCYKLLEANAEEAQLRSTHEGLELRKELSDAHRIAEVAKQTFEGQEVAEVSKLRSEGFQLRKELTEESKALFDEKAEMALLKQLNSGLISKIRVQEEAATKKEKLLVSMLHEERHTAELQHQLLSNGIAEEQAIASMFEQQFFDAIAAAESCQR